VPLTFELYVIKKDGCVFDLVHIHGRSEDAAARDTFMRFVQHFAVLRVRGHD
jgi:hypothetical protein